MTIDLTHTGIDVRIGRTYITLNRPRHLLLPLLKIWRI